MQPYWSNPNCNAGGKSVIAGRRKVTQVQRMSRRASGTAKIVPELALTLKLRPAGRMVAGGERPVNQVADSNAEGERLRVHPMQAGADRAATLRTVRVASEEARLDARPAIGRGMGNSSTRR
jgi:hypothetical protein